MAEFLTTDKSWVAAVNWSASGMKLAFCSHSAMVYIVDCRSIGNWAPGTAAPQASVCVLEKSLPLNSLIFREERIVVAGFEGFALMLENVSGQWQPTKTLVYEKNGETDNLGRRAITCLRESNLNLHSSKYEFISTSGLNGLLGIIVVTTD